MAEPTKLVSGHDIAFVFRIEPGLEEDRVWSASVLPLLEGLPHNDIESGSTVSLKWLITPLTTQRARL